jgi:hypothetical protein
VSDIWKSAADQANRDRTRALARPVFLEELAALRLKRTVGETEAADLWREVHARVLLSTNPETQAAERARHEAELVERVRRRVERGRTPSSTHAKE